MIGRRMYDHEHGDDYCTIKEGDGNEEEKLRRSVLLDLDTTQH